MNSRIKLLLWLMTLIIACEAQAIGFNREVKVLLMKDGLLSDYVNCVVQDDQNMIWIGTEFGLNRYDGIQMSAFTFDPQNPNSLSSNEVQDLLTDSIDNALWIATDGGLNKLDFKTGRFIRFKHSGNDKQQAYNDIVKIIAKDKNSFWLASYRGGVHVFDKKTGKITWQNDIFEQIAPSDASLNVRTIMRDSKNNLWIATQGNGLLKYSTKTKKVERYFEKTAANITFECLLNDKQNNVWAGTNKGLFRYDAENNSFGSDKRLIFLNNLTITDLKASKNNNELYISTNNGLFVVSLKSLHSEQDISYNYIAGETNNKGLSASYVNAIYEDRTQNLWVATASGGLNLILNKPSKFEVVFQSNKSIGDERKMLPIAEDSEGQLWLGRSIGAIYVSDSLKRNFSKASLNKELQKLGKTEIQTLYYSISNVLWIGTSNKGLISYDLGNQQMYVYNSQNSNLPDNDIRAIKEDTKGNIWVGTNRGGLCSFYQKSQSFEVYNPSNDKIDMNNIRTMAEDKEGNWWIGTEDNGLIMINTQNNISNSFSSNGKANFYIPDNYISSIYVDAKGQIWLGSRNGGLMYYSKSSNGFKALASRVGLPQSISNIEGDQEGNLWISAINSIFLFNPTNNSLVSYRETEGVNVGVFLINSGLRSNNQRIYFGATKGLIAFNPKDFYASAQTALPTIITGVQIFNSSKDEIENQWIYNLEHSNKLTLSYSQSSFSIHFVSPNYEHANETKYAYYLDGEESTWNYMGINNFATYRNLKPGKYIFKVKSSNANNIWCEVVTEIEIIISPPFWARWYMNLLYFALTLVLIWGAWKYAIARLKKLNQRRLQEIERQKTDEINNAKLEFFTNISHEFRTPITLILSPLTKLMDYEVDQDKKYLLDVMRKNANRLLRLVNEVLDFRKLDKKGGQFHFEKTNVIEYCKELLNTFAVLGKDKNINLSFRQHSEEFSAYIDKVTLEKVIINLLSNALKFSYDGGEVILSVENDVSNESIIIEVWDNGIGLSDSNKNKIFELFYQVKNDHQYTEPGSGIGLYLVKQLVEQHKGLIRVESEENKGSKFTVILPYNQQKTAENENKTSLTNDDLTVNADDIEELKEVELISDTNTTKSEKDGKDGKIYNLLIVEDDPDVRQYLVNEFKNEFKIDEAENGEEALQLSKEKPFDIVLSDIMMPRMNGIQFCEAFKKDINTSHIPLILLTAKSSLENKIEGIEYGADDYVIKPFSVKYLRTKMYSLLQKKEEMRKTFGKNFTISEPEIKAQSIDNILITKAIEYIRQNITNTELNGEMLADYLNISRVHLYRKLKAIVDCSSSEFIRRVRLKHAVTLLDANNLNISEVAYDCGFNSPAYFSTCFSSFYGMSPKEYIHKKHSESQPKNDFESMLE